MYNKFIIYNRILNNILKNNTFFVSVIGDLLFSIIIYIYIIIAQNHTEPNTRHTHHYFLPIQANGSGLFIFLSKKHKKNKKTS